mgnify:CR=1 FL=1
MWQLEIRCFVADIRSGRSLFSSQSVRVWRGFISDGTGMNTVWCLVDTSLEKQSVTLFDPLKGKVEESLERVEEIYDQTGKYAMTVY